MVLAICNLDDMNSLELDKLSLSIDDKQIQILETAIKHQACSSLDKTKQDVEELRREAQAIESSIEVFKANASNFFGSNSAKNPESQ